MIELGIFLIVLIFIVRYNVAIKQIIQNAVRSDEKDAAAIRCLQMNYERKEHSHV